MKQKMLILLQIIFIILFIFSMYKISEWFLENNKTRETLEIIEEYVEEKIIEEDGKEKETILVDFDGLKQINSDTIAYLKVNNTNISYPVVKTTDNDYYLTRSFDKTYNQAGWIFADYNNNIDGLDKNLIVYGHSRKDGSMFGSLNNALSSEWYNNEENRKITLVTENAVYTYEIFSIYTIDNESYYITTQFIDDEFEVFVNSIKDRSVYDFNIDINKEDKVLTLSTCYDGDIKRMVVHAKLIDISN